MLSITSHSCLRPFGWCVVLLLISTQSWGQETGCISGNCVNGQGTYVFTNGMKYVGEWKDGDRHGQGTEYYVLMPAIGDGVSELAAHVGKNYVGEWKDNKYHGQGTLTFHDRKYVGEFKDGRYNGQGTLTYTKWKQPDYIVTKYVGEFRDSNFNGQGTMTYADGSVKAGIWEDGYIIRLNY